MKYQKNRTWQKSKYIKKSYSLHLIAYFLVIFSFLFSAKKALAQIIPDQTLPVNSQVTAGCTICQINGGTVRGVNLFHSFQQFSVPKGGQALFNNGSAIQNIFTRVTGNSISNINGLIQTNGSANLFLLNPNGIIFGPNAQLNINGSFFATTATSFKFFDGSEFSAVNPQSPPLLTVNITPGLQYGQSPTGAAIVNRGNLTAGQDLTLLADQLDLQGQLQAGRDLILQAQNTVQIGDTNNSPFIATTGRDLTIQGNQTIDISTINSQSGLTSGRDMLFISPVRLLGNIDLTTGGYFITELLDGTIVDFLSPHQQVIKADGDVSLGDYTGSSLYILASGQVQLGNVTINPDNNGNYDTGSVTQTISDGQSGTQTVTVNAKNDVGILDVRAGINFQSLPSGFLDNTSSVTGANTTFSNQGNPTNANITVGQLDSNRNFTGSNITNPGGSVVLTNQYLPSANLQKISANIQVANIDTSNSVGSGGAIALNAGGEIFTSNIITDSTSATTGADANAGDITLIAQGNISFAQNANLTANKIAGNGNSGNINIQSGGEIILDGNQVESQIEQQAIGNGGNINVTTNSLSVTNGAEISTSTSGQGNAGNINIQATEQISLDGTDTSDQNASGVYSQNSGGLGNAGNINVTTNLLSVTNGSQMSTSTSGQEGDAGNINIQATEKVSLDGTDKYDQYSSALSSQIFPGAIGNGGNINIMTKSLSITDGAELNVGSFGQGNAGNVDIQATEKVSLDGIDSSNQHSSAIFNQINTGGVGSGGNITVITKSILITNGAEINTDSFGQGNAGNINIQATEKVFLDGADPSYQYNSLISSQIYPGVVGNGGNINITTNLVSISNGGELLTNSAGQGKSGNINIQATEKVFLDGTDPSHQYPSGVLSQIDPNGSGSGGDVNVIAKSLFITNGAEVNTSSLGQGNAGNINIQSTEQISLDGTDPSHQISSGIISVIEPGAVGNGGNISVATKSLSITGGAEVNTNSLGQGNGGSINVRATDLVSLDGVVFSKKSRSPSSISSTASGDRTGGSLDITTNQLNVTNGAQISVSSPKGLAGNLAITTDNLFLNQGSLTAETGLGDSGNNANIRLTVQDLLLMRNQSLISAQAFNQAKGGNITIDAPNGFVVAVPIENSDIDANASYGNGGRVDITTQGIFGTQYRLFNTPESDITASSQFGLNGQVIINQLNIDPSRGLQIFPTTVLDTNNQIAQRCSPKGKLASRKNQFTITGKGGLSSTPKDLLQGTALVSLVDPVSSEENHQDAKIIHSHINTSPTTIVEVQGLIIDDRGQVRLVADAVNVLPHNPVISQLSCSNP